LTVFAETWLRGTEQDGWNINLADLERAIPYNSFAFVGTNLSIREVRDDYLQDKQSFIRGCGGG
jgi:hypothetical protein